MEKTAATLPINENYQKEINIYQEERLTIFSINVRSIRNKETELFTFIEEMNFPDVICITEHWLSPFEKICIDKYQTVSLYTRDTLKHGGTAILVRKDITCNHITKFDYLITEKDFEICCIYIAEKNFYIVTIYRASSGDIDPNGCDGIQIG